MSLEEYRFFAEKSSSKDKLAAVEVDPTKRFQRSDDLLDVMDSAILYKAYDRQTGLEVIWHELQLHDLSETKKSQLITKASLLRTIHFPNINSFLHFWLNSDSSKLFYITESSTNSIYMNISENYGDIRSKVIARWFMPVLEALSYLHSQVPPITHNKISPETIYIKPATGSVKIVPPLLLSNEPFFSHESMKLRFYTPPEWLYKQSGTYSDIWSFGLSLLYVLTKILPYSECTAPADLIKKLANYEMPDSIRMVHDRLAFSLISSCLSKPEERPTALQLLRHPFFLQNFDQTVSNSTSNSQDDGFVVIFTGKSTRSNEAMPMLTANSPKSEDNLSLANTGKLGRSIPWIGKS